MESQVHQFAQVKLDRNRGLDVVGKLSWINQEVGNAYIEKNDFKWEVGKLESCFFGKGPIDFSQLPSELTNSNENFPNLYLAKYNSPTYRFFQPNFPSAFRLMGQF